MERRIVYISRLTRLPLLGSDGAEVGRVLDGVVDLGSKPPRINGVVVAVQRRRVFVGIGRIGEIGSDRARLRRGSAPNDSAASWTRWRPTMPPTCSASSPPPGRPSS